MRCLPIVSATALLCCSTMSACGRGKGAFRRPDRHRQRRPVIHPIHHATFLMQWNGKTVYVDPVGGGKPFADLPKPDLVLVTHIHFDHFDPATLDSRHARRGAAVDHRLPRRSPRRSPRRCGSKITVKILANGEKTEAAGIAIEAVPAYNTTPGKEKFHPKGRDNGYVLTMGGKRVYIAGDTEDTPEMRALKGIDIAFLPMNLPYTMSVEKAAEAIRQFKPKIVYPYHYRSGDGTKADLERAQEARRRGQRRRNPGAGMVCREVAGGEVWKTRQGPTAMRGWSSII